MFEKYALTGSIVCGRRSRKYYLFNPLLCASLAQDHSPGVFHLIPTAIICCTCCCLLFIGDKIRIREVKWLPKTACIRRMFFSPNPVGLMAAAAWKDGRAATGLPSTLAWGLGPWVLSVSSQDSDLGSQIQKISVKPVSFRPRFFPPYFGQWICLLLKQ